MYVCSGPKKTHLQRCIYLKTLPINMNNTHATAWRHCRWIATEIATISIELDYNINHNRNTVKVHFLTHKLT
jgi:hypothetical protein